MFICKMPDMENIAQRIARLRSAQNLNQSQLAELLGVMPQSVQAWESGKSTPRNKRLEALANALKCTPEYLLGGNEEYSGKLSDNHYKIDALDVTASAGYGAVKSSDLVEVVKSIEYNKDEAIKLFGHSMPDNLKIINIKGDSMSDTLESGDLVFIDISINKFDGDGIYVFTFGAGLFVKRLQLLKDKLTVISDNKIYEKWDITESEQDQLTIHAKVLLSQSIALKKHS